MSNFPLPHVILYLHPSAIEDVDFDTASNPNAQEPYSIPVWNEVKLGAKKSIAEYRTISETAQFKAWYMNWYRERKIAHGNTPTQANAKVLKAFPD